VVFDDETCQPLTDEEFELLAKKQIRASHIEMAPELVRPLCEVEAEV
jgi:hypothetical protein